MQRTDGKVSRGEAATDRATLERARGGDPRAYDAIVVARLPAAYRLACAILGPERDAADAATCALVAAWHELPRLDDLDRFDDWLDRIVISECRMRLAPTDAGGAGAGMPGDLVTRTMAAVRERPRRARRRRRRNVVRAGLALAIPVIVVLLAIGGFGGTRGFAWPTGAQAPVASERPSGTGAPGNEPAGSGAPSGAMPPRTGATPSPGLPDRLQRGVLAVVTLNGDNLRVRTVPGVGDQASPLKPLLPAGTRLLIVGGPVVKDHLEWYEVQTDGELIDLFGWVAAGDDGEAWIAPAAPRCWGELGAGTVAGLDRIDFLACYGRAEVRVQARAAGLWDSEATKGDCGWLRATGTCDVDNAWLLLPAAPVTIVADDGAEHEINLAMPPDLSAAIATLPRRSTLLLTVSMDAPEAAGCRARDADSGSTLIPDDRAVTACRLQFVVQEVAFREPSVTPSQEAPAN